jgi:hypothetical protein
MKIELTKQQLESLVKIVYLGSWVVNSWRTEEEAPGDVDEVEQIVLSAAGKNGLNEYVEIDEEEGRFFPSAEVDEKMAETIDTYNDNTFWDELIYRLADRDYIRKHGEEAFEELSTREGMEKERPFVDKYEKEFYENGLDRLEIRRDH